MKLFRSPGFWIIAITAAIIGLSFLPRAFESDDGLETAAQVFQPADNTRLIGRLSAAQKAQGVCYGYVVDSDLHGGWATGLTDPRGLSPEDVANQDVQYASGLGDRTDPRTVPAQCPRWVVIVAEYDYTSYDEEFTSVTVRAVDNIGLAQTLPNGVLAGLGLTAKDLVASDGIARLADVVTSAPLLTSQAGLAPAVPLDSGTGGTPTGDRISDASDAGRYVPVVLGVILAVAGLTWIVVAAFRSRRNAT
ncbi:hypothetical protein BTM25_36530 [Actinomadura rubteroloni]|uniref:Uncharacterized protein n=1 Tax=Actinomadura rubteroloni TaxID=1926885 RepID=A0A2P4UIX7_9ACTN|nr:hypothetical protein [Actinomadura rubteroloni]POM25012.1 hypothetical protein BTM25_36530 [Actinomadura rubteroloni]